MNKGAHKMKSILDCFGLLPPVAKLHYAYQDSQSNILY